jgi:hypothetical protein
MSYGECHISSKKYEKHHQLATIKAKRQMINTTIQIGLDFSEFPLYFSTKLDFRFRMYPLQYLLSRTSGFLKHILQDYTPRTLTSNGLKNLMSAYFAFDSQMTDELIKITSEKHTKKKLKAFFDKNRFKEIEKIPMYFAMLDKELENIFTSSENQPKTGVSIEIDQVGSGPMLVAIITGNMKLAEKCNLLGGAKQCVYTYIMEQTEIYLRETYIELVQEAPEAFEFLKTNRKAQKAALMCYMYNQKHLNRTEEFKKKFEEQKERSVEDAEYQLISKFSVSYDSFIGQIFPMLDVQLNLLEEAMLVLTEQETGVEITTLDGCILKWDFGHIEKIKRSC